ncbi:MAG TPA: thioredoxin family protein [Blastocatellia bacterium]|nr:thioredoxin family protein [Blastocatellia bacterium]
MAIIAQRDQETIRNSFEEQMVGDVEIVMFTERPSPIILPFRGQCETCEDTERLLSEVAELSDKIKLTVHQLSTSGEEAASYGIDRVPAFVLKGAARGQVRFFGIPSGYEFSAFLADLIDTSRGSTDLSQATKEYLGTLTEDVNLKVFTTPT